MSASIGRFRCVETTSKEQNEPVGLGILFSSIRFYQALRLLRREDFDAAEAIPKKEFGCSHESLLSQTYSRRVPHLLSQAHSRLGLPVCLLCQKMIFLCVKKTSKAMGQ